MSVDINTDLIPAPKNNLRQKVDFPDGDTSDIITSILRQDKDNDSRFCKFAKQFDKDNLYDLWYFVRYQIKYKEDPDGVQHIKSPAALWEMGVGDCKSKTLFINQMLRCLGIDYKIRFASYTSSRKPTHVYTVALVGNQEIILDSVYHKFNAQKAYNNKKDFGMTEISRITGIGKYPRRIGDIDVEGCVQKELEVIQQKQNVVPKDEFIQYSKLTEGEAHARLLLERFEIQRIMNEKESSYYTKAIELTKQMLYNNGKGFSAGACPSSIPEGCEQLAKTLQFLSQNNAPAMRADRWKDYLPAPLQMAQANKVGKVGRINGWTSGTCFTGVNGTNFCLPNANTPNTTISVQNDLKTMLNGGAYYAFGSNSPYAKTWEQIKSVIGNLTRTMSLENAKVDGQDLVKTTAWGTTIPYKKLDNATIIHNGQQQVLNTAYYAANPNGSIHIGIGAPFFDQCTLQFLSADYKNNFMERLNTASGIFDDFVAETMDNTKKLGNGLIYNFCTETQKAGTNRNYRLSDFPSEVGLKWTQQNAWIGGFASFTGLSETLAKSKANNNITFTNGGKTGQQVLQGLMHAARPNIGCELACITLIIGLISAIIAATQQIVVACVQAKSRAASVNPNLPADAFKPIGESLQLSKDDWDNTGAGTTNTNTNNTNTPPKKESSSKLPLLLGAAAAYYFYNKK